MSSHLHHLSSAIALSLTTLGALASTCEPNEAAAASPQIGQYKESKCAQKALQIADEQYRGAMKAGGLANSQNLCSGLYAALLTLEPYTTGDWRAKYDHDAEDIDKKHAEVQDSLFKTSCPQKMTRIRILADRGDAWAMYTLGNSHYTGKDAPQNDSEAMSWFKKAAEKEYIPAYLALGKIYSEGLAFPPDLPTAFDWYMQAAMHGDANAQYLVAGMYRKGTGTKQDNAKAAEWYQKAAAQQHADAKARLEEMYKSGEAKKPRSFW